MQLLVAFLSLFLLLVFAKLFIAPHNPLEIFNARQAPGNGFIFGTDDKGRDILLSRMSMVAQYSLVIGFGTTAAPLCAQLLVIAAVSRKVVSEVITRASTSSSVVPGIALAAVFVSILQQRSFNHLCYWLYVISPQIARIVRANIKSEYGEDYVRATIVSGARAPWILWKHVLRSSIAPNHGLYRYACCRRNHS